MVAAYVIGYAVTRDELEANPHLKFATGESDTGVIVSWNTEGRKNVEVNASSAVILPNGISINPLNWKLDETYVPASENLGSLIVNAETGEVTIGDLGADAQVVQSRGVVVTNAKPDSLPDDLAIIAADFFGPDGRHAIDYQLYYSNIKANVAKRIAAYKAEGVTDYSKKENWCNFPAITKDVDTFFIYPTEYMGFGEGAPAYAPLDDPEMRKGANEDYVMQASVYADVTNVFMPYYRQAGMPRMKKAWKETGNCEEAISAIPYDDISAALDYYFENCNDGRPFILAEHSQGSCIIKFALKHYFKEHPEYYKRMIAAYVIGYSVTREELAANPHLKFATGESDTGVIVSWNTEGRKNVEVNAPNAAWMPNSISINPLNWKLDETYAPASENLGSLITNAETGEFTIGDVGADAQIALSRGVVVTNAKNDLLHVPEILLAVVEEFFGPDSRHASDYTLYYNNIKANVAKRISAYKASK